MEDDTAVGMLSALAQDTRLQIVRFLVGAGDEGASAGEVGQHVSATSSRASFHLSALEQAGVIRSERVSRSIIYRVNFDELGQLIAFLLNDCCDHPDVRACCLPDADCC